METLDFQASATFSGGRGPAPGRRVVAQCAKPGFGSRHFEQACCCWGRSGHAVESDGVAGWELAERFAELRLQHGPGGEANGQKHSAGQDEPDRVFCGLGRLRSPGFRLLCAVGVEGLWVHGDLRWG